MVIRRKACYPSRPLRLIPSGHNVANYKTNQDKSNAERPHKMAISPARFALIPALKEILEQQAFSGHVIDKTLREKTFSAADRGLFTELLYGFLRQGHQLLAFADTFFAKPGKMPDVAKWILALAFYQKLYLTRIPDHAIVSESVELARYYLGPKPFPGLVNAVLRKFLREPENFQKMFAVASLGFQASFPDWLARRLSEQWTEQGFRTMALALNSRAPTYARINSMKTTAEAVLKTFAEAGVSCETTDYAGCLILPELSVSPVNLPGYAEGLWSIQNKASQKIAPHLDVHAGQRVLDACAGFGGKTLHMAELSGDQAFIDYFDLNSSKMEALGVRAALLGFKRVSPVKVWNKLYDRILIDAPCSGLGTTASHPEIKWLRTAKDLTEQIKTQLKVLQHYSQFLKPGGQLLYAVCSIDKSEGEGVLAAFLAETKAFCVDPNCLSPRGDSKVGTYLLPTEMGETGYFFSRLIKSIHGTH